MSGSRGNDFIGRNVATGTLCNAAPRVLCLRVHICPLVKNVIRARKRTKLSGKQSETEREGEREKPNRNRWHLEWRCGRSLAGNWRRPFTVKNRGHLFARLAVPQATPRLCRLDVWVNKEYATWSAKRATRVSSWGGRTSCARCRTESFLAPSRDYSSYLQSTSLPPNRPPPARIVGFPSER